MQSAICIVLGILVLVGARIQRPSGRAAVLTVGLAALLASALVLPFPLGAFTMGDGSGIVERRASFEELVHLDGEVRFSSHLAYYLLDRIDAALGSTAASPLEAYRALSWFAGFALAIGLLCLAATERWSPRTVRYAALAMLAPATLMYFGYVEVGYLALAGAAFPFVARDLDKGGDLTPGLLAGALMYGTGAALHGVGYLGIAALCATVMAADLPMRRRLVLATALGAIAVGAALIWVWYYLSVLGLDVVPHHAINGAIWRGLWETREAEGRILPPLLSANAARDLSVGGLISGVALVLVVLRISTQWPGESRLALAFTIPCLIFYMFLWPVQGIGIEMDMVVASFPAVYPLLWVCSQSGRASLAGAALLAVGHWTFWRVVLDERFVNQMIN